MAHPSRRSFLGTLIGGISAVVGAAMAIPLIRFAVYPMRRGGGAADWFSLGAPERFTGATPTRAEVEVRKQDGWRVSTSKQTVWVTRDAQGALKVLSAVCPHLGCVVPFSPDKGMFICPCHAGFFAPDGARISGPPPRGLDVLPSKIEGGTLHVQYQYFRNLAPHKEVIG